MIRCKVYVRFRGNAVGFKENPHFNLAATDLHSNAERYSRSQSPVLLQVAKQQPQFAYVVWESGQRVSFGLLQAASILLCISSSALETDCRRWRSELDVDLDLSRIAISVR